MARPLKYGEKTSVRSITIPDSMWENIPSPKSQWVVEAVRQMQEQPRTVYMEGKPPMTEAEASSALVKELTEQVKALPDLVIDCEHRTTVQVTRGNKCVRCGEFV